MLLNRENKVKNINKNIGKKLTKRVKFVKSSAIS